MKEGRTGVDATTEGDEEEDEAADEVAVDEGTDSA